MGNAIACFLAGDIRGRVKLYPQFPGVMVTAEIFGLSDGFHGFHIHDGEDCSGVDFSNSGSHYNPEGQKHPMHAGDLPPILSCGGKSYLAFYTDRFCITDVIGKTLVIHENRDDFSTQSAGDAGRKIACAKIICC